VNPFNPEIKLPFIGRIGGGIAQVAQASARTSPGVAPHFERNER
jgi:hypothetical protein